VYLTDVDGDSGPHQIIAGTHTNKTLKDLAHIFFKDDVAKKTYPNNIKAILGNRGLVFFVDTTAYHRAALCNNKNRLILSIDYVLRRKVPPEKLPRMPSVR